MSDTPQPSSKLVEMIVRGYVAGKLGTMRHDHKARTDATSNFLEDLETELAPFAKSLLDHVADVLPDDHPLAPMIKEAMDPGHQVGAILQVILFGAAVVGILPPLVRIAGQPYANLLWSKQPDIPLAPPDLADMVERNILPADNATAQAALSGVNADNFAAMVLNTGEPYGPMDALRLWRQGRISDAELETVVYYSRIRNQFLGDLKLLAYDTMSPADAIEAALKQVLTVPEAEAAFERGGGFAEEFATLLAASGNPIGVEQGVALLNHGLIDQAEMERIIAHSRINPSFSDDVLLTRHKFLSVFQIHQALTAGTVDVQTATEWMIADGFGADQAAAFTGAGKVAKATAPKHPTEAMIVELYESKELTAAQATTALTNLGYVAAEVPELLALYDARRELALQNAAIGRVHTAYLANRLTEANVRTDLTELEVPAPAVEHYLTTWKIERSTRVRELTPAEVGYMVKNGYITVADAVARWTAQGYDDTDAALQVARYTGTPPAGSPAAALAAETPAPA